MKVSIFLTFLFILTSSCTKEVKYTKEKMLKLAQEQDPGATAILPRNMSEGVSCSDYTEGCVAGHTVKIKGLELIAVEFASEDQAKYAAKKFRGWYLHNWFFDDVTGEPVLETFMKEKMEATKGF